MKQIVITLLAALMGAFALAGAEIKTTASTLSFGEMKFSIRNASLYLSRGKEDLGKFYLHVVTNGKKKWYVADSQNTELISSGNSAWKFATTIPLNAANKENIVFTTQITVTPFNTIEVLTTWDAPKKIADLKSVGFFCNIPMQATQMRSLEIDGKTTEILNETKYGYFKLLHNAHEMIFFKGMEGCEFSVVNEGKAFLLLSSVQGKIATLSLEFLISAGSFQVNITPK